MCFIMILVMVLKTCVQFILDEPEIHFFFFLMHTCIHAHTTQHMHAHMRRKPSSILRQGPKTIRDNCETLTVQRTKLDFEHGFQTVK